MVTTKCAEKVHGAQDTLPRNAVAIVVVCENDRMLFGLCRHADGWAHTLGISPTLACSRHSSLPQDAEGFSRHHSPKVLSARVQPAADDFAGACDIEYAASVYADLADVTISGSAQRPPITSTHLIVSMTGKT